MNPKKASPSTEREVAAAMAANRVAPFCVPFTQHCVFEKPQETGLA
jgi:hypothetical protein